MPTIDFIERFLDRSVEGARMLASITHNGIMVEARRCDGVPSSEPP